MNVPLVLSSRRRRAKQALQMPLDSGYTLGEVQERINQAIEYKTTLTLVLADGTPHDLDPRDCVGIAVVEQHQTEES